MPYQYQVCASDSDKLFRGEHCMVYDNAHPPLLIQTLQNNHR